MCSAWPFSYIQYRYIHTCPHTEFCFFLKACLPVHWNSVSIIIKTHSAQKDMTFDKYDGVCVAGTDRFSADK